MVIDPPEAVPPAHPSPPTNPPPLFVAREGFGSWFVEKLDEKRLIALCTRKEDATRITDALNA